VVNFLNVWCGKCGLVVITHMTLCLNEKILRIYI
jgi:hypothetical protein